MTPKKLNNIDKKKIDILFIIPSTNFVQDQKYVLDRRIEEGIPNQESPHIGIAYMLAIAKQNGLRAKFIDMVIDSFSIEKLLQYIEKYKPSLVGLTAYTIQIKSAGFIAKEIKKKFPETLICIGGPHATVIPKETLEEFDGFDFVICGEGELILLKIFDILKKENSISKNSLSDIKGVVTRDKRDVSYDAIEDLDALPFPAWEEFDLTKYPGAFPNNFKVELPISTSRGCLHSCIFCVRPFGRNRRHRSVDSVINEIERNIRDFGCESICFVDETFTANLEWNRELFETMILKGLNKKIKWSCETRVDSVSPELFHLMKKAGCNHIFFGFESGDDTILKTIKNCTVSQIEQTIKWAKDVGLVCFGSFIIGLPGDTEETINKSIELAQKLDIYSTTFPIAVPFPGTVLRTMAIKHKYGLKILSNNWDDYGKQYPGVMESKQLSIDKRRELQKKAYESLPKKCLDEYIKRLNTIYMNI